MAAQKANTPEEILERRGQAGALPGQGRTVAEAVRAIGVTEPTDERGRTAFGGLTLDRMQRLKALPREGKAASRAAAGPRRACCARTRYVGLEGPRDAGQRRSTQIDAAEGAPRGPDDEAALTAAIVDLAKCYGWYGHRRITTLPLGAGWSQTRCCFVDVRPIHRAFGTTTIAALAAVTTYQQKQKVSVITSA